MREASCWVPLGPHRSIVTFPLSYACHKYCYFCAPARHFFPTPPYKASRGKKKAISQTTPSGGFRLIPGGGHRPSFPCPNYILRKHTCEHLSDVYLVEWAFDQWVIVLWAFGRWAFLQWAYVRESKPWQSQEMDFQKKHETYSCH